MIAAMAGFAVEDMLLKSAAQTLPVSLVMIIFGAGGMIGFALIAAFRGEALFPPAARHPAIPIRALFEVTGRLFYTLAIAFTPLSSSTTILQAAPIVVVAGAALIFGERVGWRRWCAIVIGMLGVLIVLRPGADSFTPASLLAVLGMLGFAGRDLATRAAPSGVGTNALGVYGFAAIVVAGAGYGWGTGAPVVIPSVYASLMLVAAILFGVGAYSALTLAMRTGDVSAVTPFRYTRLVFGVLLGVLVFGERPDLYMIVGSAVVVASGLFILARGRKSPGP